MEENWKKFDQATSDLNNIARSLRSVDQYAAQDEIVQEIRLSLVEPKETGHFVKSPDWDLIVDLEGSPAFRLLHNHQRRTEKVPGDSLASILTSCQQDSLLHISALVRDNLDPPTTFSASGALVCNPPGKSSVAILAIANTENILTFRREKFVFKLETRGVPSGQIVDVSFGRAVVSKTLG